ncbi:MAG: hypothetical protein L6R39_002637 [Caloplaca ligustica]|nr:MAG: hypothetical protein L6R39_002637 [Caloplaca ligustica]
MVGSSRRRQPIENQLAVRHHARLVLQNGYPFAQGKAGFPSICHHALDGGRQHGPGQTIVDVVIEPQAYPSHAMTATPLKIGLSDTCVSLCVHYLLQDLILGTLSDVKELKGSEMDVRIAPATENEGHWCSGSAELEGIGGYVGPARYARMESCLGEGGVYLEKRGKDDDRSYRGRHLWKFRVLRKKGSDAGKS